MKNFNYDIENHYSFSLFAEIQILVSQAPDAFPKGLIVRFQGFETKLKGVFYLFSNRLIIVVLSLLLVTVVSGCSFEVVDNANSSDTDTSENVETNGSNNTEDDQEQDVTKNEQETNAGAEDENDSDSANDELEFADALRKTNDIIQTEEISKLADGKQYTFAWNYETYKFTDITCDLTGGKYIYKAISDEIVFEAEFEQDGDDIQAIHYPDEGMTVTDKKTSDEYIAFSGEYDIQIHNLGDQIVGVSMVHKDGVRDTVGEPIGFFISCTQ